MDFKALMEEYPKVSARARERYADWFVNIPEGESGDWSITKFTVPEEPDVFILQTMMQGRTVYSGEYTRLSCNGRGIIMSDTVAEIRDHMAFAHYTRQMVTPTCGPGVICRTPRILVNGLGLGMMVNVLLKTVENIHIDVVEISEDVIKLVGPSYEDPRVTIHHADAFDIQWLRGTTWDAVWHDIWDDVCADNLPDMHKLHRKYGRRCVYQTSWCRYECERQRR